MIIDRKTYRIIGLWIVFLSPFAISHSPLSAQTSMLSIGVRGGGQTFLPIAAVGASSDVSPNIGGAGTLDLRYVFYSYLTERVALGFTVGAGIGYGGSGWNGTNTDKYTNTDYLGNKLDYTVSSRFRQTENFAKADVSLLLSFRVGDFMINLGPRFLLPFATTATLTFDKASIDAYYPQYKVHVVDKMITGVLETPYTSETQASLPQYNLLVTLELGREWSLGLRHSIGFNIFADVGVWNSGINTPTSNEPLVQVHPITDASNPVPQVTVHSPAYMLSDRRHVELGIRIYYAFTAASSEKQKLPRDSHSHRNRFMPQ